MEQKANHWIKKEVIGYVSNLWLAFRLERRSSWFPPELYPPFKQHYRIGTKRPKQPKRTITEEDDQIRVR